MPALTIQEARRAVMVAHPEWRSGDVENAAQAMLAREARLDALDSLNEQIGTLQAKADAERADYVANGPDSLFGRVGGHASIFDGMRQREDAQWRDFGDRAEAQAAKAAEQSKRNARPPGWDY